MKKERSIRKTSKAKLVGVSVLSVICIAVNVTCSHFYPAIDAFMLANVNSKISHSNQNVTAEKLSAEEVVENSKAMAQLLEAEGIVLLENKSNALPLDANTKVNLYGYATIDPLYGGTGSGTSDASNNIDLIHGLKNAGFEVNQDLVDFYKNSKVSRPSQTGYTGSNFTPCEVSADQYSEELLNSARAFSDTAIIMLSRIGGEGGDLPIDMYERKYSNVDDGRHYLELTQDEEELIQMVKSQNYEKVVVLINSSNAMELGFLEEDGIDAALWIGGPGSTGFNAVGEALAGVVNPSGRLVDTYAYDLTSSPAYYNNGSFKYSNLSNKHYVEYVEGIYVGYRFYETRFCDNVTGECDEAAYQQMVQYPFGYGLSYTTFEQKIKDTKTKKDTIEVTVTVTNTGDTAGKEVVQVYYTAPYTIGGIEKSQVVLAGIAKTDLLGAGESQDLTISFTAEDMASYDYKDVKAYVLEEGNYSIKLMNNAHDVIDSFDYEVPKTVVYGEGNHRESDLITATNQFDDVTFGQITTYVSRADWEGTLPTERIAEKDASETVAAEITADAVYEKNDNDEAIVFANHGLTLEDMAGLSYDDPKWDKLLEQLSVADMSNMISNGGWSTPEVGSVGKPATNELDGPTGINSLVSNLQGTSFPSEVVVGSTWNVPLMEQYGEVFGDEASTNNVAGLYAPGMNIHRTPFSGRNFEYYSEDGFLSGKMGAAFVKGTATRGVYCYIKHFALNDQESNRLSIYVWSNEQAMREIYLKPFELSVKEGKSTAIMSSYSHLGTVWTGASKALLTNVLRNEWGFIGTVVTDSAMGSTSWMDVNLGLLAGNDMMLCLMGVDTTPSESSNTGLQAMRTACHNILYTEANSAAIQLAIDTTPYWLILLAILDVIVLGIVIITILKATKLGDKLKVTHKVMIFAGLIIAATLILVFGFFRTSGVEASGENNDAAEEQQDAGEDIQEEQQDAVELPQEEAGNTTEAEEGIYLLLTDKALGWLGCNVTLLTDGTYEITYDYDENNVGIPSGNGNWEKQDDGTLLLTSETGEKLTTVATKNEDGTVTHTLEVTNAATNVVCNPTGTVLSAASEGSSNESSMEGLYVLLTEKAQGWLGCNVYLMEDGSFDITYDYDENNVGIPSGHGNWEKQDDGSILATTDEGEELTALPTENGDGTVTYTLEVTNAATSVVCNPTGTVTSAANKESSADSSVEGCYALLSDKAQGWLGCHVYLMEDGSFDITYDYDENNVGIPSGHGSWEQQEDGTIHLISDTGEEFTTVATENGDGTVTHTLEVTNAATTLVCNPTGTVKVQ